MASLAEMLAQDADPAGRSVDELRELRARGVEVETGLSYLRRLVQGRLDIVATEQVRRREGGDPAELPELISRLPEIFAEQRRPGGVGRLPRTVDAPDIDPDLGTRLEDIAGPGRMARLTDLSDDELAATAAALAELEGTVSDYRRQMFDRIDALQAELTERYRTGEASVDQLLGDS